ncbi:YfhO family protein [Sphingomonas sp. QA11]|uniref:hypothetical protein n=1 Tax=Sphingomonas sp. QA11 TaxID=2950605 RepID=UPI00234B842B|nr:hypothetical protein [Sphingomonas sp. QA11]WCM26103.1 YfhO family protein [Sphingomonas sp. QA11]
MRETGERSIIRSRQLSRLLSVASFLAAYALAMFLFFREPILSGFDLGFGDRGDSLIEISLLEHWRNVFVHGTVWNLPAYFHPYGDTLGYNDGYFLYGLVYSFWRLFADPFHADTLNIFTFKTIGFASAYALVSRSLGWEKPIALLIAILFTIASGMAIQAGHAQLHTIGLLPVVSMLGLGMVRAERAGRPGKSAAFGCAFAAVMAAWFITSYYLAWFTMLFAGVLALCWLWKTGQLAPRKAIVLARRHIVSLAATGSAFALCIVPFLMVYLAKLAETGGHGYMISPLVTVADLINVGPGNYVWGWIFQILEALFKAVVPAGSTLPQRFLRGEHETGFPLVLFALTILALYRVLGRGKTVPAPPPASIDMRVFALAIVISWALTLQLWILSPWGLVHFLVPGARGIRIVLRYQLFLVLPVLLLVFAVYRDRAMRLIRASPWIATAIAGFLIGEQLSAEPAAQLSRARQIRDLWHIPAPPTGCLSFYVVLARTSEEVSTKAGSALKKNPKDGGGNGLYPHNVDAMLLAQLWRVPTINGFSTFNPPDWNFANSTSPDYDARVAAYANKHGLHGVCRLDVRQPQPWSRTME